MNIEITDLDMILNHLETTSLEPHDDYSSEFTYKDQKILYKYIKQLQQENKILKENAEHNDKVVDKVNWENMLLKKENKQLKERIEYLERSNNRREDTILEQRQEISDLEDNWNKLREWIVYNKHNENTEQHYLVVDYGTLLGKMQKLEQGSDSNE